MKRTYEKPTLIRRESLTDIAAGTMVVVSDTGRNGDQ